jgi:D-alanyl-D-alanine carboxypeptidase
MKRLWSHPAVLSIVIALAASILLSSRTGRSQAQDAGKPGGVKRVLKPIKPTEGAPKNEPNAVAFSSAAARNEVLRTELTWAFGGKEQRGWYLYEPLIDRLLERDYEASSANFAAALSRWQERSGLTPSGVLDEESFYAMVSEWQGKRLKGFSYATPEELITVPVADFYDPTRPDELRQVERTTYAAYKRMVSAAASDPSLHLVKGVGGALASSEEYLKIISSFRSREYQERLRRQSPNAGRAGLAVNSPHFSGRALDLYVGGDPVDTSDANRAVQIRTPVYLWLVRNAERFGFQPYCYEPWHWEYTGPVAK